MQSKIDKAALLHTHGVPVTLTELLRHPCHMDQSMQVFKLGHVSQISIIEHAPSLHLVSIRGIAHIFIISV